MSEHHEQQLTNQALLDDVKASPMSTVKKVSAQGMHIELCTVVVEVMFAILPPTMTRESNPPQISPLFGGKRVNSSLRHSPRTRFGSVAHVCGSFMLTQGVTISSFCTLSLDINAKEDKREPVFILSEKFIQQYSMSQQPIVNGRGLELLRSPSCN